MQKLCLWGLLFLALGLQGQKIPVTFYYPDSLLSEDPFEHIVAGEQLNTGILWDRAVPNISLAAGSPLVNPPLHFMPLNPQFLN